jgi:hypothetical protein
MLKDFQEHMNMKYPEGDYVASEGFDEGECDAHMSTNNPRKNAS